MLSARQAGRSIPATPSVGRERVRHKKTIETWAQWHDADDDVWRYGKSFETVPGSVLGKVYRMTSRATACASLNVQTHRRE